jgi:enoyl-[acyl-carrier-protein] reductase (NADH)
MHQHQVTYDILAGHPGGTREDMLASGRHYGALKGSTFLSPDAIADAALFLNSDMAAAITGATIPVDAGHLILSGSNPTPAP